MNYFAGIEHNKILVDARYKKWCKILHPDKNGNEEEFKAMQFEYDQIIQNKKTHNKKTVSIKEEKVISKSTLEQSNEFITVATNLIGLVKNSVDLAKEINSLWELQDKLNNMQDNKNEN
jgi:hypothetical protein